MTRIPVLTALMGLAVASALAQAPEASTTSSPSPTATPAVANPAADLARALAIPDLRDVRIRGLDGDWVQMTLDDVVIVTLAQNLDIQISAKDRSVSAYDVLRAYGIYDPVVDASVTQTREDSPGATYTDASRRQVSVSQSDTTAAEASITQLLPIGTRLGLFARDSRHNQKDPDSAPLAIDPFYAQGVGVEVTQPLLKDFGKLVTNAQITISKKQLEITNDAYSDQIQQRLADVMRGYWELVFRLEDLRSRMVGLAAAQELMRVNQKRVEVGTLPKLAQLQAEAQVALREAEIIEREAAVIEAQDNLLTLMNWERDANLAAWNRPILPADALEFPNDVVINDEEMIQLALNNRPDYRQAQSRMDIAEINRDVAKRQRLPRLDAFGSLSYEGLEDSHGDAFEETSTGDYTNYSYGLRFSYPLFNREGRGAYRQSIERVDQAELEVANSELRIVNEVRQATRDVRSTIERIKARKRQVAADTEKVDSERKRLLVGERTTFDVLDFQDDLVESLASQARAQVDYKIALIDLGLRTGVLLDYQGVSVADQEAPSGSAVLSEPEAPPIPVRGVAPGMDKLVEDVAVDPVTEPTPTPMP